MLSRRLLRLTPPPPCSVCLLCSTRNIYPLPLRRTLTSASHSTNPVAEDAPHAVAYQSVPSSEEGAAAAARESKAAKPSKAAKVKASTETQHRDEGPASSRHAVSSESEPGGKVLGDDKSATAATSSSKAARKKRDRRAGKAKLATSKAIPDTDETSAAKEPTKRARKVRKVMSAAKESTTRASKVRKVIRKVKSAVAEDAQAEPKRPERAPPTMSLKEALLGGMTRKKKIDMTENLQIEIISPEDLIFEPIDVKIPPVPMLAHGLDRVLFNPGVYRLQDPRSRIYNFDSYLEKIMPAREFNFDALSEYKTSSKDEDLLAITRNLGTKFTGSTSSMSGVLTHFHYLLSQWRPLRIDALSRGFPNPTTKFSRIQRGPNAIFLRYKDGVYAVDADKTFDTPNIMSWLGNSLEKLLTNSTEEFELYRRSSPEKPPNEEEEGKSFHYSRLGNFLMRSQLDAYDPRLPGTGVFDLKTRAVVSIRMNAAQYETGTGYQLQYGQGEWESYEREFYDMCRATILKYSLQVRMGRMDGIFVAYHNIERIFGFQYLGLPDIDYVLHGQVDTCLGDQEFKLSIRLLDELLCRATQKYPETSLRLHFETREADIPYMYIFAEPVTEEEAERLQNSGRAIMKAFERNVIGVRRDDPEVQQEWHEIQDRVNEEVDEDQTDPLNEKEDEAETENIRQENSAIFDENETGKASESEDTGASIESEGTARKKKAKSSKRLHDGPLTGWTLTVRNQVNGRYVERPENLTSLDSWSLEYYIQEIPDTRKLSAYEGLRGRREKLFGQGAEEQSSQLKTYRELLQRYSDKGRRWREEQDRIDERLGKRVYRPLRREDVRAMEDDKAAPEKTDTET